MRIAADARGRITEALDTARALSAELNPPLVREQGLGPALEWLLPLGAQPAPLGGQAARGTAGGAGRCRHPSAAVQGHARAADERRQACRGDPR
ncbi:MAG: hypothetical protein MZW92_38145 [Comamonadaceae bacterium]|nr:hypothetical protein [Comamonadaceae bacterium]